MCFPGTSADRLATDPKPHLSFFLIWYSSAVFQRLPARSFFYAQALLLSSNVFWITQFLFRTPQADPLLISTLLAGNLEFT
jgi:hypothetical protein